MARNSPSLFRSWIERLLRFRTDASTPTHAEGTLFYDTTDRALAFMADVSGNVLQIGQENYMRVINTTGSTIADGRCVYISGYDNTSGRPTIAEARADAATTSLAIGLTTHSFPNGTEGFVTLNGTVRNIDTSGFSAGAPLYLSATMSGRLTNTRPDRPNIAVAVGFAGAINASTGTVHVVANRTRHIDTLGANLSAGSITTPSRTLNSNFTPSTTRPVLGIYTVRISSPINVSTGNDGTCELRSDTNATPTTLICSTRNGNTGTVVVGVAITSTTEATLVHLFPPGHNGRLVTINNTGTPTFTLVRSVEIVL